MGDNLDRLTEEQSLLKTKEHALVALLSTPGWKIVSTQIEASIHAARQIDFDDELASVDSAFRLSRSRGYMSGLVTAMELPKALLDNIQMDLDHITTAIDQEQDDAT